MANWKRIAERAEAEIIRLNEELKRSITWSIDDFEHQAKCREKNGERKYARSKFEYALNRMIEKHDACHGICWDTIDCYLDEYCEIGSIVDD